MSAAVGSVDDLVAGDLGIAVVEDVGLVRCDWRGRSVEREADLTQEIGALLEMHFEELDYFNSSTIGTLITFIQKARRQKVHLRLVYAGNIKWQSLSFDALRMFERGDQLFELRAAST